MMAPLIFGIFLRGVRKIGYFCGGRQGYCVSTFDLFFFSFRTHQTLRSCFPKATLRSMVFDKVRSLCDITQIQDFPGYEVSLESALTWIIRELRSHGVQREIIDLSIKLDGRPFAGENTILSKYSVPYFQIPLL